MSDESAFPTEQAIEFISIMGGPGQPTKWKWQGGLTKREYFAGLAMQSLLMGYSVDREAPHDPQMDIDVAVEAVRSADALLAELEKPNPEDGE